MFNSLHSHRSSAGRPVTAEVRCGVGPGLIVTRWQPVVVPQVASRTPVSLSASTKLLFLLNSFYIII